MELVAAVLSIGSFLTLLLHSVYTLGYQKGYNSARLDHVNQEAWEILGGI